MVSPLDEQSTAALETLWRSYHRLLFALADAYCPDPHEADDIVHDAVLRLIGHLDRLTAMEPEVLKRYLARAIRNEAISHGRARQKRIQRTLPLDEDAAQLPDSEDVYDPLFQKDEVRRVLQLMGRLSPKEQTALRMKRLEHASNTRIALALGVS